MTANGAGGGREESVRPLSGQPLHIPLQSQIDLGSLSNSEAYGYIE